MRHLLLIIAGLLIALSMVTATSAHSVERAGCVEEMASAASHFEGDADQVPADADRDVPHHHGACHGHHVAAPVQDVVAGAGPEGAGAHATSAAARLASIPVETAPEPPRA